MRSRNTTRFDILRWLETLAAIVEIVDRVGRREVSDIVKLIEQDAFRAAVDATPHGSLAAATRSCVVLPANAMPGGALPAPLYASGSMHAAPPAARGYESPGVPAQQQPSPYWQCATPRWQPIESRMSSYGE